MIVDTSALLAIVFAEPGYERILEVLTHADGAGLPAPCATEAGMILAARLGGKSHGLIERLMQELKLEIVPYGDVHVLAAVEAFRRFGQGRHRAGLNFGDCMSYATAKVHDVPLLFVGDDFCHTDVRAAL